MRLNPGPLASERATATTVDNPDIGLTIVRSDDHQLSRPSQREDLEDRHDDPIEDRHVSTSEF